MTDTKRVAGGPAVPSLAIVSADQVTIVGNGSTEHPLRVGRAADGTVFTAAFRGGNPPPRRGQPVFVAFVAEVGGITTVQAGSATDIFDGSQIAGIVVDINADGTVQVKSGGLVELATLEWDSVTGRTGGLELGRTYFLAEFPTFATLTPLPPSTPGVFVTRVGIALSPRTLLLALPSQTTKNRADATLRANFAGQPRPIGAALRVVRPGQVTGASSRREEAAAIGVAVIVQGSQVVVQTAGVVPLAPAQWRVVTGSAELVPGAPYFLTGEDGRYSTARPTTPSQVIAQIGVALTTTDLLLSTPSLAIAAGVV